MTIEILWTDKCGDSYAIITTHFPGGGFTSKQTKNGQDEIMWTDKCGDAYSIITTHFPGGRFICKQTKNGQVVHPPSASPRVQYNEISMTKCTECGREPKQNPPSASSPSPSTRRMHLVHVLDSFCTYRSAVRMLCFDLASGRKSEDEFRALLLQM